MAWHRIQLFTIKNEDQERDKKSTIILHIFLDKEDKVDLDTKHSILGYSRDGEDIVPKNNAPIDYHIFPFQLKEEMRNNKNMGKLFYGEWDTDAELWLDIYGESIKKGKQISFFDDSNGTELEYEVEKIHALEEFLEKWPPRNALE